jgi:hypothetical protein
MQITEPEPAREAVTNTYVSICTDQVLKLILAFKFLLRVPSSLGLTFSRLAKQLHAISMPSALVSTSTIHKSEEVYCGSMLWAL